MNLGFGFDFGYELLDNHSKLASQMHRADMGTRMGFVGACIANGFNSQAMIAGKVDQLMPPALFGVDRVLARGAGSNKKRCLWQQDATGQYQLTGFGKEMVEPNIEHHGLIVHALH